MTRSGIAVGEVLRDGRPKATSPPVLGDHRNLYAVTSDGSGKFIPLESGINQLAIVRAPDGLRRPAILISSSPHKVGRAETPWQDYFDVDNGHIRYYGDNRTVGRDPAICRGNATLLLAQDAHMDPLPAVRAMAIPLLFFRRVTVGQRQKGFVRFEGFGLIDKVERVVQRQRGENRTFSNFAFDFLVLDLAEDDETFPWAWIKARRDRSLTLDETLKAAPRSWRRWLVAGSVGSERLRRRVARRLVHSREEQLPLPGSRDALLLNAVYRSFDGRKVEFEAVASWVAERVLKRSGTYRHVGITRASADGGFDFVGRFDVGEGFGQAKLVVLGQAKCENPSTPTNGLHVARTVARLRRGWLGVYVTTSYFSDRIQQEVVEDRYPVVLINGRKLVEELRQAMVEEGVNLDRILAGIAETHGDITDLSDPDQVLFEA